VDGTRLLSIIDDLQSRVIGNEFQRVKKAEKEEREEFASLL
jgi:hypothetical protein